MAIKKAMRLEIHEECNERCGYCWRNILYSEMQVDHIVAQRNGGNAQYTTSKLMNNKKNLLSSCRKCNHYKRAETLENFRESIKTLHERLRKDYKFEVGLNYGITQINAWSGKFYYEKIGLDKFTSIEDVVTLIET